MVSVKSIIRPQYIGYFVRLTQLAFAVTSLGLAGKFILEVGRSYGKVVYTIVISVFSIVYIGIVLAGHKFAPPTGVFLCEATFVFLWLVSFVLSSNTFASYSCNSDSGLGYMPLYCPRIRSQFIIGIMEFLMFITSSTIALAFTLANAEDGIIVFGWDCLVNMHEPIEILDNISNEEVHTEAFKTATPEEKV